MSIASELKKVRTAPPTGGGGGAAGVAAELTRLRGAAKGVQKAVPKVVPALSLSRQADTFNRPSPSRQARDAREFVTATGVHNLPDLRFVAGLSPQAIANLQAKHEVLPRQVKLLGTNFQGSAKRVTTPFLPGTAGYTRAADIANIQEFRAQAARLRQTQAGRAQIATAFGTPTTAAQIAARDRPTIGVRHPPQALVRLSQFANTPFSALGNALAGRGVEGAKNLLSAGQWGRQTTVGAEVFGQKTSDDRAKAAALDFGLALATPELKGIGAYRAGLAEAGASLRAGSIRGGLGLADMEPVALSQMVAQLPGGGIPGRVRALLPGLRAGPDLLPPQAMAALRISRGVARGGRPARAGGRALADQPYLPRQAAKALGRLTEAERRVEEARQSFRGAYHSVPRFSTVRSGEAAGRRYGLAERRYRGAARLAERKPGIPLPDPGDVSHAGPVWYRTHPAEPFTRPTVVPVVENGVTSYAIKFGSGKVGSFRYGTVGEAADAARKAQALAARRPAGMNPGFRQEGLSGGQAGARRSQALAKGRMYELRQRSGGSPAELVRAQRGYISARSAREGAQGEVRAVERELNAPAPRVPLRAPTMREPGVLSRMKRASRRGAERRRGEGPVSLPEARLRSFYNVFGGNNPARELAGGELATSAAGAAARESSPIGVRISVPYTKGKAGVSIPLAPASFRGAIRGLHLPGMKTVGEARTAIRRELVSQYGPNQVAGDVIRRTDTYADQMTGQVNRMARDESKGVTEAEHRQAIDAMERTTPRGEVPNARAQKLAQWAKDTFAKWYAEEIGAGIDIGRSENYLSHILTDEGKAALERAPADLQKRLNRFGGVGFFTKARAHPGVTIRDIEEALGPGSVETNVAKIVAVRGAAHYRLMADRAAVQAVQAHSWGSADLVAPEGITHANPNIRIPADVRDTFLHAARLREGGGQNVLTAFNKFSKAGLLATPGHDLRNQVGDVTNIVQSGQNPLTAMVRGVRVMRGKSGAVTKGAIPTARVKRAGVALGIAGHGMTRAELEASQARPTVRALGKDVDRNALRSIKEGLLAARAAREGHMRFGIMATQMPKVGPYRAARIADETLYNYKDVGRSVQVARRYPLVPFATWLAKNIPAQVRHALERPRNVVAFNAAVNYLQAKSEGSGYELPDWVKMAIPVPGVGFIPADSYLPQSDLARLGPGGSWTRYGREWGANASPALQSGLSAIWGSTVRGQKPSDAVPAALTDLLGKSVPVIGPTLLGPGSLSSHTFDAQGKRVPTEGATRFGHDLLQAINPFVSRYSQFARPTAGKSLGSVLTGVLGGTTPIPFNDPKQLRAAAGARASQWIELRRKLPGLWADFKARNPGAKREDLPQYREMQRLEKEWKEIQAILKRTGR